MFGNKSSENKYQLDMCNGPILKKMLIFTVPLMLSSILQLLFNAADIVVVGKFAGDNSLAAVGSTSSLINLLVTLFMGLSIGANVLVARYFAAKQYKALSETVHTAMTVSVISGIVLAVVGVIGAPAILELMSTPDEILPLAITYLRIYFIGMPAMMIYNFGASILRAIGDTKRPLYFLMAAGVINVGLNLLFVIVFDMDVAGVAVATTISQCVSAIFVVRCMLTEKSAIRLEINKLYIHKDKFLKIMKIGLPAGFQGTLFSLSNVVIQSSINSFGNVIVSGNSAAANIEGFVYVSMNSFYQGAISFTSQNFGAGRHDRINKILYTALGCVIAVGVIFGNAVVLLGDKLLTIYSNNPVVIEAGILRLKYICSVYALCGMMDVMVGVLRGLGYSIIPMIVSLIGACALRIIFLTTVFNLESFHKIENVYLTYPVSWIITFLAHVVTYIIVRKRMKSKE